MTDDRKTAAKGTKARLLLEDELFRESVQTVRKAYLDKMVSLDNNDAEGLMECKRMLSALNDVMVHIGSVMDSGKMAEFRLASEAKKIQRRKQ